MTMICSFWCVGIRWVIVGWPGERWVNELTHEKRFYFLYSPVCSRKYYKTLVTLMKSFLDNGSYILSFK